MTYGNEGRILLLDNERLVRFTFSALLKTANFSVTAVETPAEAIAELKKNAYDAVMTNVMMGAMDGFMFRDMLRGFNKTIPVIFLTALVGNSANQLVEKVAQDTNSYYVPKNARREYLLGRLRHAVKTYRAEQEAELLRAAMKRELEVAANVQRALLPPAAYYGERLFYSSFGHPFAVITGDLFYWFPQDDDSALVVFGDIAGHGTSAALTMAAETIHLRTLDEAGILSSRKPHLICQEIDKYTRENLHDVAYIAGTVLFADFRHHLVRYMNAGGLEPMCFRRSDGSFVELNPEKRGCLPMGLVDDAVYTEADVVEVEIPEDALLCFYSDGFVDLTADAEGEKRMPHEMFKEILCELIRGTSGTSDLGSIPYRLSAIMNDLGYVHTQDDRTFFLFGPTFRNDLRFLTAVSMRTAEDAHEVIDRASQWVRKRGFPDEMAARLELLLFEHLENVRKHGLDEDLRRYEVVILEMRLVDGEIEILAWDRGAACEVELFEFAQPPDARLNAQNDKMATSGRGLAILRKICSRVAYERFDTLNKYTFRLGPMA